MGLMMATLYIIYSS